MEAVRPYLMDLGSTNGTFINSEQLEAQRYYELMEKVFRFHLNKPVQIFECMYIKARYEPFGLTLVCHTRITQSSIWPSPIVVGIESSQSAFKCHWASAKQQFIL